MKDKILFFSIKKKKAYGQNKHGYDKSHQEIPQGRRRRITNRKSKNLDKIIKRIQVEQQTIFLGQNLE